MYKIKHFQIFWSLTLLIFAGCEQDLAQQQSPGSGYGGDPNDLNSSSQLNPSDEDTDQDKKLSTDFEELSILEKLAQQSMYSTESTGSARWLYPGMYENEVAISRAAISTLMTNSSEFAFPVFSIYQCLHCGGVNIDTYLAWIEELSILISEQPGEIVLVIEPDSFASSVGDDELNNVLDEVCGIIADNAENAAVFLDIGHNGWVNAQGVWDIVSSYQNIDKIDGWASNTSNFQPTDKEEAFAQELYDFSGKPTIIDTSRNGCGIPTIVHNPDPSEWCPGDDFALHPDNPSVLFNYHNKPWDEVD